LKIHVKCTGEEKKNCGRLFILNSEHHTYVQHQEKKEKMMLVIIDDDDDDDFFKVVCNVGKNLFLDTQEKREKHKIKK
jgi:hypothetical protein